MRTLLFLMVALFAVTVRAADTTNTHEQIPWRNARNLETESVGEPIGRVWAQAFPLMRDPKTGAYRQLIWYPEGSKYKRRSHFVSLDLQTGETKEQPLLPCHEPLKSVISGGRLYIGMNLPAHLVEYDVATDTHIDLGKVFEDSATLFSLDVAPDGTIACGSGNGSPEVAVFDPKTRKFRNYKNVGRAGTGFVYSLTHDENFIYCAPRGHAPWELVVINKKTGERSVALSVPIQGYLDLGHQRAKATEDYGDGKGWTTYELKDGRAVRIDPAEKATSTAVADAPRPEPKPEILLDTVSEAVDGKVIVHYRLGGSVTNEWKLKRLAVERDLLKVTNVVQHDGKLVGTTGPYGPMFAYDLASGAFRTLGLVPNISVQQISRYGPHVYIGGYPSAQLAQVDFTRPFTTAENAPMQPGIPWTDRKANPWMMYMGHVVGDAHDAVFIEPAADKRIYVCGMRHRHHKGFGVGWFDPATNETGKIEDGGLLDHYQVCWMTPLDGGKQFAISTRVQYDDLKEGTKPERARIFILDVATRKFVKSFEPFPDATILGPMVETSPGRLLGLRIENPDTSGQQATCFYQFDLESGKVLKTRLYAGFVYGLSSKSDLFHGHSFRVGPDGWVWTFYKLPYANSPGLLSRIHPDDLSLHGIGTIENSNRFLFVGRDIYLTGTSTLRRIQNIVPE